MTPARKKERLTGIKARVAYTQGKLDEALGRYVREAAERGLPDAIGLELEWWNRRIVEGASGKPVPPEAPPAETCAECGKVVLLVDGSYVEFPSYASGGKSLFVHGDCIEAWNVRKRGERLWATLKPGDAVRMAVAPRPVAAPGGGTCPDDAWHPCRVAGEAGIVGTDKIGPDCVQVTFLSRGQAYWYHACNLTRLVPDPDFAESSP